MAIKAVYQKHGAVAWGHSVLDLLDGLRAAGREIPSDLFRIARGLDRLYIPARYPDGFSRGKPADYFTRMQTMQSVVRKGSLKTMGRGFPRLKSWGESALGIS
jgi:HEPN domain-containing protein